MARYYRRRYTRVVRPKKKWAACIRTWKAERVNSPFVIVLSGNQSQTGITGQTLPTPTVVKVGNFKATFDFYTTYSSSSPVNGTPMYTIYILFVPEGIADDNVKDLVRTHPEYIMATKTSGSSYSAGQIHSSSETVNLSTRLKRNLNSGDRIVMIFDIPDSWAQIVQEIYMTGNVRYWVCNN